MASETNLSKVNVFPSEATYNANKASIGTDEISLVKVDNIVVPGYVSAGGVKLQPITFKKMTLLAGGTPTGSGNITLSQPYTNFDGLYFVFGNDGNSYYHYNFIPVAELTRLIGLAKSWGANKRVLLTKSYYYWAMNATTSTTTFLDTSGEENCYFCACYGVTI